MQLFLLGRKYVSTTWQNYIQDSVEEYLSLVNSAFHLHFSRLNSVFQGFKIVVWGSLFLQNIFFSPDTTYVLYTVVTVMPNSIKNDGYKDKFKKAIIKILGVLD